MIKLKRAYDPAEPTDGFRVLVDRLWPRGVAKSRLPLDDWAKELAPSAELRKEFGHDPSKWKLFRRKYLKELKSAEARSRLKELANRSRRSHLTLIYSAHDEEHNNAVVLEEAILGARGASKAPKKKRSA